MIPGAPAWEGAVRAQGTGHRLCPSLPSSRSLGQSLSPLCVTTTALTLLLFYPWFMIKFYDPINKASHAHEILFSTKPIFHAYFYVIHSQIPLGTLC